MAFHWRKDNPLTFPNDFGENGFRLPKYVVKLLRDKLHSMLFNTNERLIYCNRYLLTQGKNRIQSTLMVTVIMITQHYFMVVSSQWEYFN